MKFLVAILVLFLALPISSRADERAEIVELLTKLSRDDVKDSGQDVYYVDSAEKAYGKGMTKKLVDVLFKAAHDYTNECHVGDNCMDYDFNMIVCAQDNYDPKVLSLKDHVAKVSWLNSLDKDKERPLYRFVREDGKLLLDGIYCRQHNAKFNWKG